MSFISKLLYEKEGKGINKDDPEKKPFFKFWEIFWNKRFKLIAINLMYFFCNLIPAFLSGLSYMVAVSLFYSLSKSISISEALKDQSRYEIFFMGLAFVMILFTVIPVFAAGPCQAGFMYIIKSFIRREPVFIWYDFTSKTRSNFKLSIVSCLINAVIGFVIMIDVSVYLAFSSTTSNAYNVIPGWLMFIGLLVIFFTTFFFFSMLLYIYPMIVMFKLTLKQLYKNAVIFVLIRWLRNIGIVLLNMVMILIPLLFINGAFSFYVSIFAYFFIGIAFMSYMNTSFIYPAIKKHMLDNPEADQSSQKELTEETDTITKD